MAFNLDSITSGTVMRPPRIILLGVEKIGKSTWAAAWPGAIGLPVKGEEGIDDIDVPAFPPSHSVVDLISGLSTLRGDNHQFQTVFLDSASTLEPLIHADVCASNGNVDSIEKVGGGYGKGYTMSLSHWRMITEWLDTLRTERNMASIIIGHVKVKRFDDPAGDSYDQYQFDIHDKAANLLYRWADVILFANTKVVVKKEDVGFNKETKRGIDLTGGARFLYTQKNPAHPGGGRGVYGRLPYELPLDYNAFLAAIVAADSHITNVGTTTVHHSPLV